jgi:hypothetical protein
MKEEMEPIVIFIAPAIIDYYSTFMADKGSVQNPQRQFHPPGSHSHPTRRTAETGMSQDNGDGAPVGHHLGRGRGRGCYTDREAAEGAFQILRELRNSTTDEIEGFKYTECTFVDSIRSISGCSATKTWSKSSTIQHVFATFPRGVDARFP